MWYDASVAQTYLEHTLNELYQILDNWVPSLKLVIDPQSSKLSIDRTEAHHPYCGGGTSWSLSLSRNSKENANPLRENCGIYCHLIPPETYKRP
jgi:hypothetical protein